MMILSANVILGSAMPMLIMLGALAVSFLLVVGLTLLFLCCAVDQLHHNECRTVYAERCKASAAGRWLLLTLAEPKSDFRRIDH